MSVGMVQSPSMHRAETSCACPSCGRALSSDAVIDEQASRTRAAGKRSEFEDVTMGELFALIVVIGFVAWAALSLMSEPLRI